MFLDFAKQRRSTMDHIPIVEAMVFGVCGRLRGGRISLKRGELFRLSTEKQAEFISKGDKGNSLFVNVLHRIPKEFLLKIDHSTQKRYITRTQWILEAIIMKIEKEEKDA
jgi:hypothetical protein